MPWKCDLRDPALRGACAERPRELAPCSRPQNLEQCGARAPARRERRPHLRSDFGPDGTGGCSVITPHPSAEKDPSCYFQDRVARLHHCRVAIQDLGFERLIRRKNLETTGTLRPGGPFPASLRGAAL